MPPVDRKRVVALDKARVWHPYTEMSHYRAEVDPFVIVEARGSRLLDANGREYLDGNASWWTCTLGHNHPRLVAALQRQAQSLCHTALAGIAHENASELAEALCAAAPDGLEHVFYSDNGSTAVEVAMKLVIQYWAQNGRPERTRFISLEDAFHGETVGVTALGGVDVFRAPFAPVLADCDHIASPGASDTDIEGAVEALAEVLRKTGDSVAAVVLEPMVQGAAGMHIYEAEYVRKARDLCDRHDTFLICDEVFTGYGRTGPLWAVQHAGVTPDILCTAKGFTGGMLPMAATLTSERIFEGFLGDRSRAFHYGHSFSGNPLGAAVAREVLRVIEDEDILVRARPKADRIAEAFDEMRSLPGVAATRSLGMIGALDLEGDEGYLADAGWRVFDEARERGAYLRPLGNVVYVTPSINIPDDDLDRLLDVVQQSVAAVTKG